MKFLVSEEVARFYPELRIGILIGREINNHGSDLRLDDLKRERATGLRQSYSLDSLKVHPNIVAWRDTYRTFGVNPKKTVPTAEALMKRVLKGSNLPTISKVVDSYLVAESECLLPVGGYDLKTITGDIVLRFSSGSERFVPLGSPQVEELTKPGEIIYADGEKVLTRSWNYRDSDLSKVTEASTNVVLFSEAALPVIKYSDVEAILEKMKKYLLEFCGGEVSTLIADVGSQLEWVVR